jgi:hypothetical protein
VAPEQAVEKLRMALLRGHWEMENRAHWVWDATMGRAGPGSERRGCPHMRWQACATWRSGRRGWQAR